MPRITVDRRQRRAIGRRLKKVRRRASRSAREGVKAAGYLYAGIVRATISVPMIGGSPTSHAAGLADLDHPYATRHGSVSYFPTNPLPVAGFETPEIRVHKVSGELYESITTQSRLGRGEFRVFADTKKAPHALFVAKGTSVMLPRDFVWGPSQDLAVRRALRDMVVKVAGSVWRSGK